MQDLNTVDCIAREGLAGMEGRERGREKWDELEDEVEQMREIAQVCVFFIYTQPCMMYVCVCVCVCLCVCVCMINGMNLRMK